MEEEWRPIKNYESTYAVSNIGNVKNIKTGRILKQQHNNGCGYLQVMLSYDGNKKLYSIHRLVAESFLDNINNHPQVDHINNIKTDNRVENLRWVSRSENNRNKPKSSNRSSKFLGVFFHQSRNKYVANLTINGKNKYLGCFKTEEEAHEAWKSKVIELGLSEFYASEMNLKTSVNNIQMDKQEMDEQPPMPNFVEAIEVEDGNVTISVTDVPKEQTEPKKRGRKKGDKVLSEDEKKSQQKEYYEANKLHRLQYKQAVRGTTKALSNQASLSIEWLPKMVQGEKRKVANLDYLNYDRCKRTLTITQPTEELLNLIRLTGIHINENVTGVEEN